MVNKKLINYAKAVYQIECEKEIEHLFKQIVSTREIGINKLITQILYLQENFKNEEFFVKIDRAIALNSRLLEDVRVAVSSYMRYYDASYHTYFNCRQSNFT